MNPAQPDAEAVAVRDGRILAVGSKRDVQKAAGKNSEMIDLDGRALLPGFVDPHSHLFMTAAKLSVANLSPPPVGPVDSIDKLKQVLREYKEEQKLRSGAWLFGMGYDDTAMEDGRHPTRNDLDDVSKDHPIMLVHISGHLAAVNSLALEKVSITKYTVDPEGGVIRREPGSDEPNGVLEETAMAAAFAGIPAPPEAKTAAAVERALMLYASKGITTAQEDAATGGMLSVFKSLAGKKPLPIDVVGYVLYADADEGLADFDRAKEYQHGYRTAGLKLVLDGSIQGYSAYLREPYHVQPGEGTGTVESHCDADGVDELLLREEARDVDTTPVRGDQPYRGYPAFDEQETVTNWMIEAFESGWQVQVHTNGNAATDMLLSAVRAALERRPQRDHRTTIIHAQTMTDEQLDDAKELGLIPSFFPGHVYYWGDRHRDIFLGPDRAARINPARSALDRGMIFTLHHDSPIIPADMMPVVSSAVNRVTAGGTVLGPEQRIPVLEALKAITINAAYQIFEDKKKGSIETGKLADLVVLSENPLTVDPMKIKDITIEETIKEGRVVYRRD
jgi:predicted amidohydrolase YtcJ